MLGVCEVAALWIGLGAVLVVMLGTALLADVRDRGRGGEQQVRMPDRADRRTADLLRASQVNWQGRDERVRPPRELEAWRR